MKSIFASCLICLFTFTLVLPSVASPVQFGKPRIRVTPNGCQSLSVVVSDSIPDDEGLSDVYLVFDPGGIAGPAKLSYNVWYDGSEPQQADYVGNPMIAFGVHVIDPLKPAYAAIYAQNHIGLDELYEWHYTPTPDLNFTLDTIPFTTLNVGSKQLVTVSLVNEGTPSAVKVTGIEFPNSNNFKVESVTGPSDSLLATGGRLIFSITISPALPQEFSDTIYIDLGCYRIPIIIAGQGKAPLIDAEDAEINGIDTNSTGCTTVRVWNRGNSDLQIDGGSIAPPFTLQGTFPSIIAPGDSGVYIICFTPTGSYGTTKADLVWSTNEPTSLQHGIKDVSHITGTSAQGGLHWDRRSAHFSTKTGIGTLPFHIMNTAGTAKRFDSIIFEGAFPHDFVIENSIAYHVDEQPEKSIPCNIHFHPDTVFVANRSATAYIISNGIRVDSLQLTGTLDFLLDVASPEAAIHVGIYPNPASNLLHVTTSSPEICTVEILDLMGRTSTVKYSGTGRLDISVGNLQDGEYFARVSIGQRSILRRFTILR